jgi:hypothetical protein
MAIEIRVPELKRYIAEFTIEGITGYLGGAMPEDALPEAGDEAGPKAKKAKPTPDAAMQGRRHLLEPERDNATDGIPAAAFAGALISACRQTKIKMTEARGIFYVLGGPDGLLPIIGEGPVLSRMQGCNPNKRGCRVHIYRPLWPEWQCTIPVEYNPDLISLSELAALFRMAGSVVGVGDARPEKCPGLAYGRFAVVKVDDLGSAGV